MADNDRTYSAGRFMLDIDGFNVGYLKKFSGLGMQAEVVTNDLGPANVQKKHVSTIKWEPGKCTVGIGMGKGMYDWIKSAFDMNFLTKTGTVTMANFNYEAQRTADFNGGLITSVTVPALSGDSKEAAYFDIEWEAEQVRWAKGGGKVQSKIGEKQKAWLCSNFKFELGGLPCNRVAKIDSFSLKCAVTRDAIGTVREYTAHPAKVTVPDLKLSISMADYDAWAQAAKKWFVDGKHLETDEMTGRIVFLGPDMKEELGEIELQNVGFKSFKTDELTANSESVLRFSPELYVEKMVFKISKYDS